MLAKIVDAVLNTFPHLFDLDFLNENALNLFQFL